MAASNLSPNYYLLVIVAEFLFLIVNIKVLKNSRLKYQNELWR